MILVILSQPNPPLPVVEKKIGEGVFDMLIILSYLKNKGGIKNKFVDVTVE